MKAPSPLGVPIRRVAVFLAIAAGLWLLGTSALASSLEGSADPGGGASPSGGGLRLLGGREAILLEQSDRARRSARARGLWLYRLLRSAAQERRGAPETFTPGMPVSGEPPAPRPQASLARGERLSGRVIALATTVLRRDIYEARLLRAELDRVRAERMSLSAALAANDAGAARAPGGGPDEQSAVPAEGFLKPVSGPLLVGFGVEKDASTGAWMFRAAATFSAEPGEAVRSPGDGRVVRVATSVAGGAAVVVTHQRDRWTTIVSGLDSVAVAAGETVVRGEVLGSMPRRGAPRLRLETWRGRTPVDPIAVLRSR